MGVQLKTSLIIGSLLFASGAAFAQTDTGSSVTTDVGRTAEATANRDLKGTRTGIDAKIPRTGYSQVIQFKKGQATLSAKDKADLKSMLDRAKAQGEIENVHVAVWADKPFPKAKGAELSEADKNLAEQRIDVIEGYLKDQLKIDDIETYSMAEGSNWFARAFNTDEGELKSLFSQGGAPSVSPEEFKIVRQKGGAMKAVILVEHDKGAARGAGATGTAGENNK